MKAQLPPKAIRVTPDRFTEKMSLPTAMFYYRLLVKSDDNVVINLMINNILFGISDKQTVMRLLIERKTELVKRMQAGKRAKAKGVNSVS